jgi:signal transduction histidine kinase
MDEDLQFTIFRITQEQINNIVRHAGAKNIWLSYISNASHILISIKDDGAGFDLKNHVPGLGFENIRNRLSLYEGKMELRTAQGKGCTLLITIPLNK